MTQEQVFPSPETTSLSEKPKNHRIFIIAQLILRALVPLFTLAAIIRTITSAQITMVPDGGSFGARYSYSSALRYMVIADIVVGVSCFLSLILVFVCFIYPKWNIRIKNYVYIFLHDLVLLLLITSATSAASSIGMLALHGESKIGWTMPKRLMEEITELFKNQRHTNTTGNNTVPGTEDLPTYYTKAN
ncbi:CASP-like protein 1F2 [Daucus carota subsp. sativus]|uniref:CASP-like protein 1F2 n=1 Tax=Daucus carota subsp. sativus TaxID=79200 RepID=UPI0007EFF17D|nr:PREDICTED: CASP-like protein 1F2 [Daucus carota subsp. sativus]